MRSVGLKVLKNRLSEYVRIAAAGETVLVTDRNKVVAELVPPQPQRALPEDVVLAQLVREGVLTPATDRSRTPPPRPQTGLDISLEDLMKDLDEARADRFDD
jgi:prevent-host-death family protein